MIGVRIRRAVLGLFAVLLLLAMTGALIVYLLTRASMPVLDGDVAMPGLQTPVTVTRDARGTVAIRAATWVDGARALGFVHGQERFFEMDLTRRSAAGELSALLGADTLAMDKEKRPHRFRARMAAQWQRLPAEDKTILTVYAEGVNAGLRSLAVRPWQYLLLNTAPEPWREEDSLLVIAEMYYVLQSRNMQDAFDEAALRQVAGDRLFNWLKPRGGHWDAALDGSVLAEAPMPSADELNTRINTRIKPPGGNHRASAIDLQAQQVAAKMATIEDSEFKPGSNNWAVSGALSAHGAPILADDMHLSLSVPNIWFRGEVHVQRGPDGMPARIAGVTLPGVPGFVVGSNGHVAWGFTSAEGDWFDWVPVQRSADGHSYIDGDKTIPFDTVQETIAVRAAAPVRLDVRNTRWGPVLRTWRGRDYALNWLAHWPGSIDAKLEGMMFANTIDAALKIAQTSGVPQQNILIVDRDGGMAWTIAGRLPARQRSRFGEPRKGFTPAGEVPVAWLSTGLYPQIRNPAGGRLWTANSRQLGGSEGEKIGEGRGDLGARSQQIRDRLHEAEKFDEASLYAIQLDDQARFMKHWVELVGRIAAKQPERTGFSDVQRIIAGWNGRAGSDQAAYAISRRFRIMVVQRLKSTWFNACAPDLDVLDVQLRLDGRMEYPVWAAISARAPHLLPTPFATWDDFLSHELSVVVSELQSKYGTLDQATWGNVNTANIRHPIAGAAPRLLDWLNMPATPLSGDNHMPHVATRTDGASERMIVSPGREERGILTMPGGQSGHPLSPFYGAGHQDWLNGIPTPLLAGEARHSMVLQPHAFVRE